MLAVGIVSSNGCVLQLNVLLSVSFALIVSVAVDCSIFRRRPWRRLRGLRLFTPNVQHWLWPAS